MKSDAFGNVCIFFFQNSDQTFTGSVTFFTHNIHQLSSLVLRVLVSLQNLVCFPVGKKWRVFIPEAINEFLKESFVNSVNEVEPGFEKLRCCERVNIENNIQCCTSGLCEYISDNHASTIIFSLMHRYICAMVYSKRLTFHVLSSVKSDVTCKRDFCFHCKFVCRWVCMPKEEVDTYSMLRGLYLFKFLTYQKKGSCSAYKYKGLLSCSAGCICSIFCCRYSNSFKMTQPVLILYFASPSVSKIDEWTYMLALLSLISKHVIQASHRSVGPVEDPLPCANLWTLEGVK